MKLNSILSFIRNYPTFRIKPSLDKSLIIEGKYQNILFEQEHGEILVDYELAIHIPENFPLVLPTVFEISNKIEKVSDNHINYDGSLCLGAPFRIKEFLNKYKTLTPFFEECVLPYLYAVTLKIKTGQPFVFGELAHGSIGLIEDLKELFQLPDPKQISHMLKILSGGKKEGNRSICPCGCNKRLSTCRYFKTVQRMRKFLSRHEWEEQYNLIK